MAVQHNIWVKESYEIYTAGSYNNKLICPILLVSVTSKIPQLETCHQEKYLNNSKLKPPLITMNATR